MFSEQMNNRVAETFRLASPKGDFGIEIETEGRDLPAAGVTRYFVGKADGSLRNGMEYVSKVLPSADVRSRVDELALSIARMGARVEPSYRSSTHIHYNMCQKSFRDVLGMVVMWSIVEPIVFRLMPPGRDGSLFCVSSYDSGELPEYIDRFCTEITDKFRGGFNPRGKYSALNLTRLGNCDNVGLGTLEYRVFPTSLDGTQIQEWCTWIENMYSEVRGANDDSFLTMVRYAEQNPLPFLQKIFGRMPIPENEAGEYVDFGARTAYELARVINRHIQTKPKVKPALKSKDHGAAVEAMEAANAFFDPGQPREVVPAQPVPPFPRANRAEQAVGNQGRRPAVAGAGARAPAPRRAAGGAAGAERPLGAVGGAVDQIEARFRDRIERHRIANRPVSMRRTERELVAYLRQRDGVAFNGEF